jgi:hypothetical protein
MRPQADQANRLEEDLKEASTELAQTHKKVLRLENIVEKYKLKAEESTALLRQNEVTTHDIRDNSRYSKMRIHNSKRT